MIFNYGSGNVAAGSWKFKALTAKPEAVAKNTMIGIVTTLPTNITVADEQPANPAANDVWFHIVNPEDSKVFSDGSVPIHIVGAYQLLSANEAATATTTITSGGVTVAAATFRTKVDGKGGTHVFTFDGSAWKLSGIDVALADYGITVTNGTAASGNTITIVYVAGWSLLTAYYSYLGVWHELPGLPPVGTALQNCSWAQIDRIGKAGKAAEYFCIGDEKPIALSTSEVITLQIIGFNHDNLSAAGGGKAPITFCFKDCMATAQQMNPTNTNVGGYSGCALYTTINNAIYNSLPDDLRAVMKNVSKLTSAGNQSASIVTTQEKLFMLSELEIFGSITDAKTGEGTQYAFFTNGGARVKTIAGVASDWWGRSPHGSNVTLFCFVSSSGAAAGNTASVSYGVALGLCV